MLEKVRKAMEALEARNITPSVRKVRDEMGGGGYTEIGEAMREVKAEREALRAVRTDLPRVLQDKVGILALDLWTAAQEIANREVADVRQACDVRVAAATSQAEEALQEIDQAEHRIRELVQRVATLETAERAASVRAETAEARAGSLEAEVRVMQEVNKQRERELDRAYQGVNRMAEVLGTKHKSKAKTATPNGDGNAKSVDVTG
nr:DNA-binding protein [Bradyrhizobium sp. NBAIM03]